jgi:hypothetical protein
MRHLFVPDTQVRLGVPTDHLEALGNYIEEKRFEKIIFAGDHWDMRSCSNYNSGLEQENLRVLDDIEAGIQGMHLVWNPIRQQNKKYTQWKKRRYEPERHFLMGNHEVQLARLWENDPRLEGLISYESLGLPQWGFRVHEFLDPVNIDGILYCHYFANPNNGRPYGGMIETRLKNIANSFTQGHAQSFAYGEREVPGGKRHIGCVAGAFYMHDEPYKGPYGNHHWRGVIVKNEVNDGEYDIMKVSLNYLLRKYL